jgi:2-polyprenyl-3-methyl-5-hydroxy-6-metoxy-1,4-benzoquinol methylase
MKSDTEALEAVFMTKQPWPWTTRFLIDGKEYGGSYEAYKDARLKEFRQNFPDCKHVLELGCLEGGHSVELAKNYKVTAIDGRNDNLGRAQFIRKVFEISEDQLRFRFQDLDTETDLNEYKDCDVVFCVGVLYHLKEPWKLIEKMSKVSKNLFLWTHYSNTSDYAVGKYLLKRINEGAHDISTAALVPEVLWFTRNSLFECLRDNGYSEPKVILDNDSQAQPSITLCCRR